MNAMSLQRKFKQVIIVSLVFSLFSASVIYAEDNSKTLIKGYVREFKTGKILSATNVYLAGTSYGAATNDSGYFEIRNIPKGHYQLIAKYIGYKTFNETINLSDTSKLILNIELNKSFIWIYR